MAIEKTEIVLLTTQRIPTEIEIMMGTDVMAIINAVKYLEMHIDCHLTLWKQIGCHGAKVAKVILYLSELAIVGELMASKRRLLMSVTYPILLTI